VRVCCVCSAFHEDGLEMRYADLQTVAEQTRDEAEGKPGLKLADQFSYGSMKELIEDVKGWDGRKVKSRQLSLQLPYHC
jgi:hypothetical protein